MSQAHGPMGHSIDFINMSYVFHILLIVDSYVLSMSTPYQRYYKFNLIVPRTVQSRAPIAGPTRREVSTVIAQALRQQNFIVKTDCASVLFFPLKNNVPFETINLVSFS